jgi:hypothetical protein
MRSNPRYRELMLTVYPNNWGPDASFENAESCTDRSEDLAAYKIRDQQSFRLAAGVVMRVKAGSTYDPVPVALLEEQIAETASRFSSSKRSENIKQNILHSIGAPADTLQYDLHVFTAAIGMTAANRTPRVQSLLIANRLAAFEDMRDYMRGTRAHVEESKSADYVNILELQDFLGDQMRESINTLVSNALRTEDGFAIAQDRYAEVQLNHTREQTLDIIRKAQPDKLGLSDSFVEHVRRQYRKVTQQELAPEDARTLIATCDALVRGPETSTSDSTIPGRVRARVIPLVRAQRERTLKFAEDIGKTLAANTPLASIDVASLTTLEDTVAIQPADRDTLHEYFIEHLHDTLRSHREALSREVSKFEAEVDSDRKSVPRTINAYITKNATSSHARKSAGVCVSVDNPARSNGSTLNQWDMPEFFQMVLQDDTSKVCLGAVLLHAYNDRPSPLNGKGTKVLVAAFNPSSTFLYQVNEKVLFTSLFSQLQQFAIDNKFDKIAVSTKRYNRTNRTGGDFENALLDAIAEQDESYSLESPQPICHAYNYTNDDLNVLWNRPTTLQRSLQLVRNLFGVSS